ncbi:hypothetical protein Fmac_025126 [Flemingia macrophylla]|uniref:non-specific serine/threonine protein kinase n=1 Tax=Flemingia macrophylla TaxID=520843 RepID=A0ABD1LRB2_9FABA
MPLLESDAFVINQFLTCSKSRGISLPETVNIMATETESGDISLILLKQGAEARIFESSFVGRRSVVKERFSKKYRHPTLDSKLTFKRLNASKMYIEGYSVKDVFGPRGTKEWCLDNIASQIGVAMGKLHDGGLVHCPVISNYPSMMFCNRGNSINFCYRSQVGFVYVLIDFGLSFTSTLLEDKAVDLYVLERAILSMHSSCGNVMDQILAAYRKSSKQWSSTMNKLAQVRQKGRKRTMVG